MSDIQDRKRIVDGLLAYVERKPRESLPGWIIALEAKLGRVEMFDSAPGVVVVLDGSVWGLPFKLATNEGFGKRLAHFIRVSQEVSRLLYAFDEIVDFLPSIGEVERAELRSMVREGYHPQVTVYIYKDWRADPEFNAPDGWVEPIS